MSFSPAISQSHARELENACTSVVLARQRRAVWVACTSDCEVLASIRDESPKRFAEMVAAADVYRLHAEEMASMAQSACARLGLVAKE